MDTLRIGIEYFEIVVACLRCYFENFFDFLGVCGYIVAVLELVTCLRIVLEWLAILEWKVYGTNFHVMLSTVLKLILNNKKNFW